jgi:hypothetical protein
MAKYTIRKIKIEQEIGKFLVVQFQSMAITCAMITVDICAVFQSDLEQVRAQNKALILRAK